MTAAMVENDQASEGRPWDYLLQTCDTRGPMATLFTEPNEDGTYKQSDPVPFGKPLTLPELFGTTLHTEEFPV